MAPGKEKILLTGFGPFPGMPINASAPLVCAIAAEARQAFPEITIEHDILETSWTSAPARIAARIAADRPALALHFGVAHEAQGFRIERMAANACRATGDAAGCLPGSSKIDDQGPACEPATIDVEAIVAHLRNLGLPAEASDDAGAYLCNAVLYASLAACRTSAPACRAGFIHIPHDLSGPPLNFGQAISGGLEIMRLAFAASARNRR